VCANSLRPFSPFPFSLLGRRSRAPSRIETQAPSYSSFSPSFPPFFPFLLAEAENRRIGLLDCIFCITFAGGPGIPFLPLFPLSSLSPHFRPAALTYVRVRLSRASFEMKARNAPFLPSSFPLSSVLFVGNERPSSTRIEIIQVALTALLLFFSSSFSLAFFLMATGSACDTLASLIRKAFSSLHFPPSFLNGGADQLDLMIERAYFPSPFGT